jgi:hypothetical protein
MTDIGQAERGGFRLPKSRSRLWLQAWLTRPTSKSLVMNVAILLALCIWFSIDTSEFMSTENLSNLVRQVAFVGIAACVVTPVMVAGGLDLSIGSIVAVAGVVAAKFVADGTLPSDWPSVPAWSLAGSSASSTPSSSSPCASIPSSRRSARCTSGVGWRM